jgi:dihydroorotase
VIAHDLLIKNARMVDPSRNLDETGDLLVSEGKIKIIGRNLKETAVNIIDASGLVACPGFIDLHCHLRQPGFEHKETIASGSAAALHGGYTTICCMPNTNPAMDTTATIDYVKGIAALEAPYITVLPVACITRGRAGKEITEMSELANAGCIGFSDDGNAVASSRVLSLAMETAANLDLPIIEHCEDAELSHDGQINDGWVAARLGLKGIPAAAEETIVSRDITLAKMTGARLHLTHISTKGSVDLVRAAKANGIRVTADVTPHHLTLTEERVLKGNVQSAVALSYDTNAKVNPPLRTTADIDALIAGLIDGSIDAIATDHAPHADEDKLCEFELAAFGTTGFETAFGALMTLVHADKMELTTLIACLTSRPARILSHLNAGIGMLGESSPADIVLLDLNREWTVDSRKMFSKGKNTPYEGRRFNGMVVATIHRGRVAYKDNSLRISQ